MFEEIIKKAIQDEIQKEADELIEIEVEKYRKKLQEETSYIIGKAVGSIIYQQNQDPISMGVNVILSFRR